MVDDTDNPEIKHETDTETNAPTVEKDGPVPLDIKDLVVGIDSNQIDIEAAAERVVYDTLRNRFPTEKIYYNVGVQVMPTGQGQMGAVLAIVLAIDHMVIGERIVVPLIFPQPVVRDEDIEQHVAAAVEQAREIRAQSLVLPPQG